MTKSKKTKKLDQEIVSQAVSKLKIKPLADHLAEIGLDLNIAADLLQQLRLANGLVLRQLDAKKAARRNAFLKDVTNLLRAEFGDEIDEVMDPFVNHIQRAEDGYHRVRASLAQSAFAPLSLERRCAAAIARTVVQVENILEQAKGLLVTQGAARASAILRDENGRPVNADGAVHELVLDLGGMLFMEAYEHQLFDGDGKIVLPNLPTATDDDIYKAGLSELGGRYWSFWAGLEEASRAFGGDIEPLGPGAIPPEAPADAQLVYAHKKPLEPWPVFASRIRLIDRSNQHFVELLTTTNVGEKAAGIDKPVPLSGAWVNLAEFHGLLTLSEYLAREVVSDTRLVEGLRFIEWIRGYATLAMLAEERWTAGDGMSIAFKREELSELLQRVGLTKNKADRLLDAATFGKGRRDLFDAPLIRLHDGRLLLFGPALIGQRVADVLTSLFSSMNLNFDDKGKAFEKRVLQALTEAGRSPTAFKFKRGVEEYDYDAIFAWGDYVFLLECKNRSLPGDSPTSIARFAQDRSTTIGQVKRLLKGLADHPEELDKRLGAGAAAKTIVPIILRNLPYAEQGPQDGIYFYDYSALSRFFKNGRMSNSIALRDGTRIAVPTFMLWAGAAPEPADFLAQLDSPVQLQIVEHHTRIFPMLFRLDSTTFATTERYILEEVTPDSVAALSGAPDGVMAAALKVAQTHAEQSQKAMGDEG
jgi:hypothetical protein